MPRVAKQVNCNENDLIMLESIANNPFSPKAMATRARIILLANDGMENKDIAEQLNVRKNTVSDIRRKYLDSGIDGLYDKKRAGRRGNENSSADDLVLAYIKGHEDIADVAEICEATNLPDYSVYRVLRNHCIQLSRNNTWNTATADALLGRYLRLSGIYISGSLRAVIIRALRIDDSYGEGVVTTKDRTQHQKLEEGIRRQGSLSLAQALAIAVETPGHNGKPIPFPVFLEQLIKDESLGEGGVSEYHILLYCPGQNEPVSPEILRHRTVVHTAESPEAWHAYVEKVLSVLEPVTGFTSNTRLLPALDAYLRSGNASPFAWHSVQASRNTQEVPDAQGQGSPHSAHIEQSVDIHEGQSLLVMSGVLLNCSNEGKITQTLIQRSSPVPSPEDFDFSSVEGYAGTVSAFDSAIAGMSSSLNSELMGACLDSHFKKNG